MVSTHILMKVLGALLKPKREMHNSESQEHRKEKGKHDLLESVGRSRSSPPGTHSQPARGFLPSSHSVPHTEQTRQSLAPHQPLYPDIDCRLFVQWRGCLPSPHSKLLHFTDYTDLEEPSFLQQGNTGQEQTEKT